MPSTFPLGNLFLTLGLGVIAILVAALISWYASRRTREAARAGELEMERIARELQALEAARKRAQDPPPSVN